MPKINADQLARQLDKAIPPVILICGDETLLIEEAADRIRQKARKAGFTERELHHTDANFSWQHLIQNANSLSLFSEKKILEIRIPNGKPGDQGSKALCEYCANYNEDTLVLLICPKLDRAAQNSKWFKTVESTGATVIIWPINPDQLPTWLDKRLKANGLEADSQAIDILVQKVEGNLLAGAQEIEKLKLLSTDTLITAQTMKDAVSDSARFDVFTMIDKALNNDAVSASAALHGLQGEGAEPMQLLWAITNELRTLASIKEATDAGIHFSQAAKGFRVWKNRERLIQQSLSRFSIKQLHLLVRKCVTIDKTIKGMGDDNTWPLLLDVILSLANVNVFNSRTQKMVLK